MAEVKSPPAQHYQPNYDADFNLRARHPIGRLHLLKNSAQSLIMPRLLRCDLDLPYGDTPGQRLDIFPAPQANAPVFVFVHGGYFRALDKSQYRYIARPMVAAGCSVALVNYDLAPRVTVAQIIEQVLRAFDWLRQNIGQWNGDPGNILLCGHSVGAFLAASILQQDWPGGSGVRRAALLSGLYDLEPMRRSFLNTALNLSPEDSQRLNPGAAEIGPGPDILLATGGAETGEFLRQTRDFGRDLTQVGRPHDLQILPGITHYTMSRLLARQGTPITNWLLQDLLTV